MTDRPEERNGAELAKTNASRDGPHETLRDGRVKATIWKRESSHGTFFTGSFSSTYEDKDGQLRDGQSFSGADLLKVSELARRAYHRTRQLERAQASPSPAEPKRAPEGGPKRDQSAAEGNQDGVRGARRSRFARARQQDGHARAPKPRER